MKNHVEVNSSSIKKYIEKQLMWLMFHFIIQTNQNITTCEPSAISSFYFPLTNQFKK
jgi:hypothetical protein